jgi:hypothetical protein
MIVSCSCSLVVDATMSCYPVSFFHSSETTCSKLTDKDTLELLEPFVVDSVLTISPEVLAIYPDAAKLKQGPYRFLQVLKEDGLLVNGIAVSVPRQTAPNGFAITAFSA